HSRLSLPPPAATTIYTLSLHDALPISSVTESHRRTQTGRDTNAIQDAQKFLAELSRIDDPEQLRQIAFATVWADAAERSARGMPARLVVESLAGGGVDQLAPGRTRGRVPTTSMRGGSLLRSAPGALRPEPRWTPTPSAGCWRRVGSTRRPGPSAPCRRNLRPRPNGSSSVSASPSCGRRSGKPWRHAAEQSGTATATRP